MSARSMRGRYGAAGWTWRTVTLGTRVTPRPEAAMASWVKIELARWRISGLNPALRQVAMSWSW